MFALAFVVAPRSCEGGLEFYFWFGVSALAVLLVLPFATRMSSSIWVNLGWACGFLMFGLGLWLRKLKIQDTTVNSDKPLQGLIIRVNFAPLLPRYSRYKSWLPAPGGWRMGHSEQTAVKLASCALLLATFALAMLIQPGKVESESVAAQSDGPPNRVVWLHYDYMVKAGPDGHSHEPNPRAIDMVVEAFRLQGIVLHIDPVHNAIPEHRVITLGASTPDPACAGPDAVSLDNLRVEYFQPTDAHVWHYAVFGHRVTTPDLSHSSACPSDPLCGGKPDPAASGGSEIGGLNFAVTFGSYVDAMLPVPIEGLKEVLGLWIAQTEGAKFWLQVVTELKNRGVTDIFIACVDGLKGFPEAIESVFPQTEVQLCIVHLVRHSLNFVGWKQRKEVAADLKLIYRAATESEAEQRLDEFSLKWDAKFPMIAKSWRSNWARVIPLFAHPPEIRKVIYTTNAIESLNMSLRKVTKARGSFPNDEAVSKLLYLALRNIAKKWTMPVHAWKDGAQPLRHHLRKPAAGELSGRPTTK
jgi:hypothetical protein